MPTLTPRPPRIVACAVPAPTIPSPSPLAGRSVLVCTGHSIAMSAGADEPCAGGSCDCTGAGGAATGAGGADTTAGESTCGTAGGTGGGATRGGAGFGGVRGAKCLTIFLTTGGGGGGGGGFAATIFPFLTG